MKIVKLQVDGMSCASCAKAVEKSISAVPGVEKASVNFVSKTAAIAASSVGEFVAAGEVAFIMLLGEQLENYTIRRARRSLGNLLSLVPPTARVRRDGKEEQVAASELQVGDIIVVRAGERIPVD